MKSNEVRFEVHVKKAGQLADSVVRTVTKKTSNPVEAMVVLKLAAAIFEAYLKDQDISIDAKQFDTYVSEFMGGYLRFKEGL